MKPIEQLDKILAYLNHDSPRKELRSEIQKRLDFKIDEKDLLLVLEKLCKDGFVDYIHLQNVDYKTKEKTIGAKIYYITFEGRLFIENDGYAKEKKDKNVRRFIDNIEVWAVILGGVFAFLYYFDQLSSGLIHQIFSSIRNIFCHCFELNHYYHWFGY